jgi:drug/metabolite transporter (DMT)-like permease
VVVYVFWGGTYLAIRVGVETVPPLLLAGVRYLIAGLILYPLAIRGGSAAQRAADRPRAANWLACAVVGLLLLLGGNGGVSVGERSVPSGFASLLVATVPLWLLVLDAALNRARVGVLPVLGLLAGLAGVGLLAGLGDGGSRGGGSGAGIAIILVAALSWALGTIGPGSILALSAYSMAVRSLPTPTVATYAYVNPVVAVFLGATVLGEAVTPTMLLGGGLIIVAVALVVRRQGGAGH